jgi:hypothetical protein
MTITKRTAADKIAAYLHHEITLAQLVDWAERALMDGEFSEAEAQTLAQVVSRSFLPGAQLARRLGRGR